MCVCTRACVCSVVFNVVLLCVCMCFTITRVLSSVHTKRFEDFVQTVVAISRGGGSVQFEYDAVSSNSLVQENTIT